MCNDALTEEGACFSVSYGIYESLSQVSEEKVRAPRTKSFDADRYKIIFGAETTIPSSFGSLLLPLLLMLMSRGHTIWPV